MRQDVETNKDGTGVFNPLTVSIYSLDMFIDKTRRMKKKILGKALAAARTRR